MFVLYMMSRIFRLLKVRGRGKSISIPSDLEGKVQNRFRIVEIYVIVKQVNGFCSMDDITTEINKKGLYCSQEYYI